MSPAQAVSKKDASLRIGSQIGWILEVSEMLN